MKKRTSLNHLKQELWAASHPFTVVTCCMVPVTIRGPTHRRVVWYQSPPHPHTFMEHAHLFTTFILDPVRQDLADPAIERIVCYRLNATKDIFTSDPTHGAMKRTSSFFTRKTETLLSLIRPEQLSLKGTTPLRDTNQTTLHTLI